MRCFGRSSRGLAFLRRRRRFVSQEWRWRCAREPAIHVATVRAVALQAIAPADDDTPKVGSEAAVGGQRQQDDGDAGHGLLYPKSEVYPYIRPKFI